MYRRPTSTSIALAVAVLSLSACSDGDRSTATSGDTPQSNIDAARANVAALMAPPSIEYRPGPLPGDPAGKHVVAVFPTTSKGQSNEATFRRVAESLDIDLDIRNVSTNAEEVTNVFDEIAQDASIDGLFVNSRDPSMWQRQFDKLSERGVPIVLQSITDDPAWTSKSVNVVSADRVVKQISRNAADWMVADSDGAGDAVVFTVPVQATLVKVSEAFTQQVGTTCPGCSVDVVDVKSFSSIGRDLPGQVVSYLQANPEVKYVFAAFGDMLLGVPDALRAVGLDDAKLISQSGGATNMQYLRVGIQAADFAYTHPYIAYVALDALARGMTGGTMEEADAWMMPAQLLTPDNIGDAAVDGNGAVEVTGLEEYFRDLWAQP